MILIILRGWAAIGGENRIFKFEVSGSACLAARVGVTSLGRFFLKTLGYPLLGVYKHVTTNKQYVISLGTKNSNAPTLLSPMIAVQARCVPCENGAINTAACIANQVRSMDSRASITVHLAHAHPPSPSNLCGPAYI